MSCTMHTLASSSVRGTPTAAPSKEMCQELLLIHRDFIFYIYTWKGESERLFWPYLQGWHVWRKWQQPCRGRSLAPWPVAMRSERHTGWWSQGNRWQLRGDSHRNGSKNTIRRECVSLQLRLLSIKPDPLCWVCKQIEATRLVQTREKSIHSSRVKHI